MDISETEQTVNEKCSVSEVEKIKVMSNKDLLMHKNHLEKSLERHVFRHNKEEFFHQKWELKKIINRLRIELAETGKELLARRSAILERKVAAAMAADKPENMTTSDGKSEVVVKAESIILGFRLIKNGNGTGKRVVREALRDLRALCSSNSEAVAREALRAISEISEIIKD